MATSSLRRTLRVGIVLLLVIAIVGVPAGIIARALLVPVDPDGEVVFFVVEPGTSLRAVAEGLADAGLIRSAPIVELWARQQGYAPRLQAGSYRVSSSWPAMRIVRRMVDGEAESLEVSVTIPEGWSADDIESLLEERGLYRREEFAPAVVMQEAYRDFAFLAPLEDDTILDGYLFPDTYRILPGEAPVNVVRRMLATFERRVDPESMRAQQVHDLTLHELLTLASIVQKESGPGDEAYDVAGVFWNRLQIGMRLESDATVNYVLGTSKRQPTFADTEVQHPYNTYENAGLPPGPIGNPGVLAIRAAASPRESDYLFFLHKNDGEIVLSRTFAEHLAAKARYLD